MPILFETATIKSMFLADRFVRSATWEEMANEDGSCSRWLIDPHGRACQRGCGADTESSRSCLFVNKNDYPRAGLLEAALRFTEEDMPQTVVVSR